MSDAKEPTYYLFLAGDPCPEWIERIEPAWSDRRVVFCADAEAFRHAKYVEIRPLFPLTYERPHYLKVTGTGDAVMIGRPTTVWSTSRHFPDVPPLGELPIDLGDEGDEGEEWKR